METIGTLLQDLRAMTQEFRAFNERIDSRVKAMEQGATAQPAG